MNTFAFSSLLVFISSTVIATFVFLKGKGTKVSKILGLFCLSVAIWGCGGYILSITKSKEIAFIGWQIGYIGAVYTSVLYSHFVITFLSLNRKYLLLIVHIFSIIFVVINIFARELFLGDLRIVFNQFYWTNPTLIWWIYHIIFDWILLIYSFSLLLKMYKRSISNIRNQLKYFILGSLIGWLGAHGDYLVSIKIDIYPYANFLIAIYPLLFAYAIIKHHLMDIKVAVTRAGLFLVVYTLVLGFPFWLGYHTKSWFMTTLFMFVMASIGPIVYRFLQKKAENLLLAQQRRYQRILLQASGGMVREHKLGKLLKLIVYVIKRIVKIEFAAIFLEDKDNKCYRLMAIRNHHTMPANFIFPLKHPLITLIKRKQTILLYEEIKPFLTEFTTRPVYLVVPSFMDDSLSGFLVLGEKNNRALYTDDDINVFKILSHQAALAIENCLFFEEFKKAQEKIFVAEKLASIGGMADGVAHQIKNRLNHFSIATGEMQYEIQDFIKANSTMIGTHPPLKKTFDYLCQIADSLITNVKRTDGIIKGILNYARTSEKDTFFSKFSFREIVDLSLELLKVKHEIAEFPLESAIEADDTIYGVKAQLMEVIYNILDNGYEAVQEKLTYLSLQEKDKKEFTPRIFVKLTQKDTFSFIEVIDNGIGVKEEDRHKIFAPFFTTKSSYKSGTGIGMYVVKRLIEENHNGKVWFSSVYPEGTGMFIKLPKK